MRRIAYAGAATLLMAAGLAMPSSASAAAAPTISGPKVVPYYAKVALHGTTPEPNQKVTIFFQADGAKHFTARRHLRSDADGLFSTSYHAAHSQAYYAHVGGAHSAIHRTRLVTADCTISRPAFTSLPLPAFRADRNYPDFAVFTATNGKVWAGVNVDMSTGRFAVIVWRRGHRPKVLDQFRYRGHPFRAFYEDASVRVVGISSVGSVVASVQHVHSDHDRRTGFVWSHGERHELRQPNTWSSIDPSGMAADGSIIGTATIGSGRHSKEHIVQWTPNGRHVHTLLSDTYFSHHPAVDRAGDVGFDGSDEAQVRRHSGEIETLPGLTDDGRDPNRYVAAAGGRHMLYGTTDLGTVRWTLGNLVRVTRLAGTSFEVDTAGSRGDVILGDRTRPSSRHLRTASGAYVRMPRELGLDAGQTIILGGARGFTRHDSYPLYSAGAAINSHGTIAFTSAKDGLVHFLRCR